MDLLSAFKRKKPAAAEAADGVQLARNRARQRLIGAAVLVVAGIIGFPLLFETEPRPLPVDLTIEAPIKEGAAPLAPSSAAAKTQAKAAPRPAPATDRVIDETAADAGREVSAAAASAPAVAEVERSAAQAVAAADTASTKPSSTPPQAAANHAAADAARAKALLEGKPVARAAAADAPPSAAGAARYVVQVGAFADPAAVKSARTKVERLGLVTYTQVAQTAAGARTRVRVGPFSTRDEAERAAARIKSADLPTVILAL